MRLTVENFKGIGLIENFKLEHISVLAGTNSGGKSSLVQLIMLLKQSLEARSPEAPLKLNKPYVSLGRFENLLRRSPGIKTFKVTVTLEEDDLDDRLVEVLVGKRRIPGIRPEVIPLDVNEVSITAEFKKPTNKVVVTNFEISLTGSTVASLQISRRSHGKSHGIKTNADDLFFRRVRFGEMGSQKKKESTARSQVRTYDGDVRFAAFFPDELDIEPGDSDFIMFSPVMNYVRNSLNSAFERISYIGPLREEPREFYYHDDDLVENIGNKGENAAFLLSKHAEDGVQYTRFSESVEGDEAEVKNGTLKQAVNYWLCEVFGLAKELKVDRAKTNRYLYSVSLRTRDGSTIPITHVGFGISQIFPILVEGLRSTSRKRLIILEQPEIHLHPRVQSWLFDFIRTVPNVSFLVETHSDHFINRLRRRIAEDNTGALLKSINLTYVNPTPEGVCYERLELSSSGSLMKWPVGFFDQYEGDMKAIVRAQALKRRQIG